MRFATKDDADLESTTELLGHPSNGTRPRRTRITSENGASRYTALNKSEGRYTDDEQQLLAIWNKAKGKERDALLWGDEVRFLKTGEMGGADGFCRSNI